MLRSQCGRRRAVAGATGATAAAKRTRQFSTPRLAWLKSSSPTIRANSLWLPKKTTHASITSITALQYSTTAGTAAGAARSSPTSPSALEKPDYLDDAESAIWDKLVTEFAPTQLTVQDISGGCGSMYGIEIASHKFRGVNMLKQQRMVNAVLGDQLKGWHGLQLRTRVP
ncbi:bola-like protein [Xylariomycetidae sp. FL0641]|nr:bola-like protein [Xylariomycetidae sp. FL0641]